MSQVHAIFIMQCKMKEFLGCPSQVQFHPTEHPTTVSSVSAKFRLGSSCRCCYAYVLFCGN